MWTHCFKKLWSMIPYQNKNVVHYSYYLILLVLVLYIMSNCCTHTLLIQMCIFRWTRIWFDFTDIFTIIAFWKLLLQKHPMWGNFSQTLLFCNKTVGNVSATMSCGWRIRASTRKQKTCQHHAKYGGHKHQTCWQSGSLAVTISL